VITGKETSRTENERRQVAKSNVEARKEKMEEDPGK